jgi:hypothetical protein
VKRKGSRFLPLAEAIEIGVGKTPTGRRNTPEGRLHWRLESEQNLILSPHLSVTSPSTHLFMDTIIRS